MLTNDVCISQICCCRLCRGLLYCNATHDILSHMLCNAPPPPSPPSLSLFFYLRMGQGLQLPIDLHSSSIPPSILYSVYIKTSKAEEQKPLSLRWLCTISTDTSFEQQPEIHTYISSVCSIYFRFVMTFENVYTQNTIIYTNTCIHYITLHSHRNMMSYMLSFMFYTTNETIQYFGFRLKIVFFYKTEEFCASFFLYFP